MNLNFLSVPLLVAFLSATSFGQALSKQDVIDLKKAGVDKTVLIQQIHKDGINFEMNAATTIELKNLGFSDDVLSALLGIKSAVAKAVVSQNDSIHSLYAAGRFPELADALRVSLKVNPSDYKSEALLIVTLLKMREKEAAQTEFRQLAVHDADPAAAPFVKQLSTLFESLAKTQEAKGKLMAALKDYRVSEAETIMDQLSASPMQKEILKVNLDIYEGKFDQARDRFLKIRFESYSEKERSAKFLADITEAEAASKKVTARIDLYLYSKWASGVCRFPLSSAAEYAPWAAEFALMSVQDYINQINALTQLTPLNGFARDLSFHAQLLSGNYDQLELLGDRLLGTTGSIRIPFFAADRFFRVIIDSKKRRIYTEADPRPFQTYAASGSWLELVPFDLSFDQIKKLTQKAGHWSAGLASDAAIMAKNGYALKFEPSGVAPNYSVRNILYCNVGEKAEATVTRNLGLYILHVVGNKEIKAELADPSKAKGSSSGWFTGLLMAGAMASGNPSVTDAAVQGLQADQAQQAANFQAQRAAWESFTTRDTFNFVEADAFTGLEGLLGVLN